MPIIIRARVVLSSIVTRVAAAVTLVTIMLPEVLDVFAADTDVVVLVGRGVAILTGIVAVIRKVTMVLDTAEGLLAVDGPVTSAEARLERELETLRRTVDEWMGGAR